MAIQVKLNLAHNGLSELPAEFLELTHLRVLFFLGNRFAHVPHLLGRLRSLFMLSFKSNCIAEVCAPMFIHLSSSLHK